MRFSQVIKGRKQGTWASRPLGAGTRLQVAWLCPVTLTQNVSVQVCKTTGAAT